MDSIKTELVKLWVLYQSFRDKNDWYRNAYIDGDSMSGFVNWLGHYYQED